MSKRTFRTDFLFAKNGLLMGIGNAFNLSGNYFEYNYASTDREADKRSIESDWGAIGQDIWHVVNMNPCTDTQSK